MEQNTKKSSLSLGQGPIFQVDNDFKHTAEDRHQWFKENQVKVLESPSGFVLMTPSNLKELQQFGYEEWTRSPG